MRAIAPPRPSLRLRFFFVVMASAVVVTVFAGFAPTFYLRGSFAQTRPMSVLLHVHGVVFSAWVSFFLVQTLLIERASRRLHQRLGWIGAGTLLSKAIRLAQALDAVRDHRIVGRADVSSSHPPHRQRRYGQGLDCFDAAGGCIFPAVLCLRLADPP
jgi:hypothetical protein